MKKHNPMLFDFVEYKVEVTHQDKRVTLGGGGMYNQVELKSMTGSRVRHLLNKGQATWAHLFTVTASNIVGNEAIPEK